jgi:hypothetical protein
LAVFAAIGGSALVACALLGASSLSVIAAAIVLALGIDPWVVVLFEAVLNASAVYTHGNYALPVKLDHAIRKVFCTPDMHRVHHSIIREETDSNYGFFLSIWDRMFGTFVEEDRAVPVDYGLVKNLETFNPVTILTHEYVGIAQDATQRGLSVWQRLCYIFAPPGWSHDGSRLTSADIKREAGLLPNSNATAPQPRA